MKNETSINNFFLSDGQTALPKLTHGSLFSGIGGFEVGAERAGIETLWNCEFEKHNREILKRHFPNTLQYDDIRTMRNPRYVDIISGGFPCQDISVAGNMEGIKGSRSGLWSEMFRVIREVRPRYSIIENSPALLIRGFERVLLDLSEIGYDAEWQCISNHTFGYPHKRERIYIIAYPNEIRPQGNIWESRGSYSIFKQWTPNPDDGYTLSKRIYETPTSDVVRNGDGFRSWTHRVGSVGNAVNPTVAHYLFSCIEGREKKIINTIPTAHTTL